MELCQKLLSLAGVCAVMLAGQTTAFAADSSVQGNSDPLVPGYTEQYTFKVNGTPIGGQSATLSRVENGQQTWVFTLNLVSSSNGQPLTFKQTGTFVVGSDGQAVSFDSISLTNGVAQTQKVVFGARGVTADFDPAIPGIDHTVLTLGEPYLLVNNLVTPLSLATRAAHPTANGSFVLPSFSVTYLKQGVVSFIPKKSASWVGRHFNVYDGTLTITGQPDSTFEYWLSPSNGEIVRAANKSENLVIVRN